jgi:hypothetical protein
LADQSVHQAHIKSDAGLRVYVHADGPLDPEKFEMFHAYWDSGAFTKLYKKSNSTAAAYLLTTHFKCSYRDNQGRVVSSPGEAELMELTGLSRATVSRCHQILKDAGLIAKIGEGRGSFGEAYTIWQLIVPPMSKSAIKARQDRAARRKTGKTQPQDQCIADETLSSNQCLTGEALSGSHRLARETSPIESRLADDAQNRGARITGEPLSLLSSDNEFIIRELTSRGVGDPKRTELSRQFTADVIQRYCQDYDVRKTAGQSMSPGWLIRAIESSKSAAPYALHRKTKEVIDLQEKRRAAEALREKERAERVASRLEYEESERQLEVIDASLDSYDDDAWQDIQQRYLDTHPLSARHRHLKDVRTHAGGRRAICLFLHGEMKQQQPR